MTNIGDALFKATGATTGLTHAERAGYIVNVKDYGAVGNGIANDTAAVQAASDVAFGSSSSPHGSANKHLNRPLYFPTGTYNIHSTIIWTKVCGGRAFGDAAGASTLSWGGSVSGFTPLVQTNGFANCVVENLGFAAPVYTPDSCGFDLDWNGDDTNCDGLRNNLFSKCMMSGGIGILVAKSDNDGASNLFLGVEITGHAAEPPAAVSGLELRGSEALGNTVILGGANLFANAGYYAPAGGGSFGAIIGVSQAQRPDDGSPPPYVPVGSCWDFRIDSPYPCMISGVRSESYNCLRMAAGEVRLGNTVMVVAETLVFANVTGGKCTIDGCRSLGAVITGATSTIYLRGNSLSETDPSALLTGYTGTIGQNI